MITGPSTQQIGLRKALVFVLLLFVLSIFIRLPNLTRPVSKHYEFNTAVVMINLISWRQAGGGDQFHYTPVMNFQHPGDKLPPNNLYIDKNGNSVYLSFGPGWYVIPYFVYQFLHLPADPVYLVILNLFFHLASILLFFYFLEQLIPQSLPSKYFAILGGCSFMIFTPGVLWFMGNGYVNIGIMTPFVLGIFILILPMMRNPNSIRASKLTLLGILIVMLVYIDWYILILSFLSGIFALLKIRINKKYGWLFLVIVLSVSTGIALVFLQFSSHMGSVAVKDYWFRRFSDRSLTTAGSSFLKKLSYLFVYFITSYLPLILLLLVTALNNWRKKIFPDWSPMEILFLRFCSLSLLLYNFLLFEWSTDHEFAILPWCILLSFLAARLLGSIKNKVQAMGLLTFCLVFSVVQYYWINRPGPVSRDGLPYNSFKNLGESLRQIPADYTICIKLEQNPMVEYYARRNILLAPDSLSVKNILKESGIKKAVWVTHNGYQLEKIRIIQ